MKRILSLLLPVLGLLLPLKIASAHEAYVLPYSDFWSGMEGPFSEHAFDALRDPQNIHTTIIIVASVLVMLALNFAFRLTKLGQRVESLFVRGARFGPQFVRIAVAIALFYSAESYSFLGPELHGDLFPHAAVVRGILYAASFMIAAGFLTELAGLAATVIFIWSFFVYGAYTLTYLNYLGEFLVLMLFGLRSFSIDKALFGPLGRFESLARYETLIVRACYGLALIYAAITVKLLHPDLTIEVVRNWNLTQFHWLFPHDPLLVTFGAGVVECVIGIFILFGFEMRITILISLFYITLSLLYFRELVWPHLMLYGISFNLLVQPETFTLDHILFEEHRKFRSWWKRPFDGKAIADHKTHQRQPNA